MKCKGFLAIGLAVTILLSAAVSAGAAPVAPTGPLAPGPTALAQVIEGAKKEGTVMAKLVAGFKPESMGRLEKGIKDKYGVDLKIKFTGATKMTNDVAEAIMEQKAGAIPSFDLLTFSNHIAVANKAGVLEQVDWKPLLSEGTNPSVIQDSPLMRGGLVYDTAYFGLLYNPEKIKAEEVPRTLADMANPRWKGKGAVETSGNSLLRWSFILGKEKVLSALRAIMKNGAIQGSAADLMNRYLIGEIWFCRLNSEFIGVARDRGMPAAWQSLDFADVTEFASVVRKGASHANAAKLVGLYLASPEGAKFGLEEANYGTLYYPGNYQHDIRLQNQRQGIPEVFSDRKTDLLEFYNSKEASDLSKEIALILQTGGRQ